MTRAELVVVDKLAQAYSEFAKLPTMHPDDQDEFTSHIHACQNMVMARQAVRTHPKIFVNES